MEYICIQTYLSEETIEPMRMVCDPVERLRGLS